jgi:hypothetical protein
MQTQTATIDSTVQQLGEGLHIVVQSARVYPKLVNPKPRSSEVAGVVRFDCTKRDPHSLIRNLDDCESAARGAKNASDKQG